MPKSKFLKWLRDNALRHETAVLLLTFKGAEYVFRIPIGDYFLQLDRRIAAAIDLLPHDCDILVCRKDLEWRAQDDSRPLQVVLRQLGIGADGCAVRLTPKDRQLAFVLGYLTNRWGNSRDSLYLMPDSAPDILLFFTGSPESVFVVCRTLSVHNRCVNLLAEQQIPAYGKHIEVPLPEPTYDDIQVGRSTVAVDRKTGKPIGPGSAESVLLPEFLPVRIKRGKAI